MPLHPEVKLLITDVVQQLVAYLDARDDDTQPVTNYLDPKSMHARLATIAIADEPATTDELKAAITMALDLSVKMGHRKCLNQLFHRADPVAILGDFVTSVLNTSIYTYEIAPLVTVMEMEVIERFRALLGWKQIAGTFPPGGSMSNLYGIVAARHARFPHVASKGWQPEDKPVFFCSDTAHYSSKKSAALIGVGYDALVSVPVDAATNAMDPSGLDRLLAESVKNGRNPFCVVATAGTTLTGAIDPIDKIVAVARKYPGVWVHVDGALGGALAFSRTPEIRGALAGIEGVDSFITNPHKMMGCTLQCTLFLTNHVAIQEQAFSTKAAYLFNADKDESLKSYDVGDQVFQCGRHVDVLKLFLMWRARGDAGMGKYVDDAVRYCRLFASVVVEKRRGAFQPLLEAPSTVPCFCFFYIPRALQHQHQTETKTYDFRKQPLFTVLDKITPKAKFLLMRRGTMLLTMSKMGTDVPNFWRFVANGATPWTEDQIGVFLDEIAAACEEVYAAEFGGAAVEGAEKK